MPAVLERTPQAPVNDGLLHIRGLHPAQRAIYLTSARFRVLNAGRRFGKTRLAIVECFARAVMGRRCWWVGPDYPYTQVAWRGLKSAAYLLSRQGYRVRIVESLKMLEFPGGGWVQVRSADNPESLRSEGLDFVVLDEAARMAEVAWTESLRPALMDFRGGALFISTPKGRNWYWRLYQHAGGEGWARWTFPSSANPFLDPAEIATAKASSPERIFRQEWLAEFIQDGAGVFRKVDEAATATPQDKAVAGHRYVTGVDWAKQNDFTVFVTIDTTATPAAVVCVDRSNQVDYALQRQRLQALNDLFAPDSIVCESNSMGEPIIEELCRVGLPVMRFVTTNASKMIAIEALVLAFEQGKLKIIPDENLVAELKAFESKRTASGLTQYRAPEGTHDDCVMALAFAWEQAKLYTG